MDWFKKYGFIGERINDPVYNCKFYKDKGCSHVDGMYCDMKTCNILQEMFEGRQMSTNWANKCKKLSVDMAKLVEENARLLAEVEKLQERIDKSILLSKRVKKDED